MGEVTTIRIESKVKDAPEELKNHERESFNNVIERLVNMAKEEDEISEGEIKQIEESLEDIKKERVLPLKEAEKKWGI